MIRNNLGNISKFCIGALVSTILTFVGPISNMQVATANPGGTTTSPLLWLDATDIDSNTATANPSDSATVSTWTDKSSNSNNASVLAGQGTPTYSANSGINNGPAIRFTRTTNTSGTVFVVPNVDIRAGTRPDVTIFAVYRAISPVNGSFFGIWGQDDGTWDRFAICCGFQGVDTGVVGLPPSGFAVGGAGTGTRLLTVVYDGNLSGTSPNQTNSGPSGASSVWFEGGQVTTFTDNTTGSTRTSPTTGVNTAQSNFRIGWDGDDSAFNGWISEIIIYGSALSSDDIVSVSNYLGAKYDLTIAPTPVTQAATNIDSTTATLNGTVNAHRDTTTSITIRYSTDSSTVRNNTATSPTVTPTQVGGNTDVAVSASISGLNPSTTYWFRVTARNSRGTNSGTLQSFTTTSTSVVLSCSGAGSLSNGSFESGSTDWRTTALDGGFEIWSPPNNGQNRTSTTQITGPGNAYTYDGNNIAEIAANNGGDGANSRQGLYQDVNTISGSRIFWSYWHKHRAGLTNADQVSGFRAGPTPTAGTRPAGSTWTAAEQEDPFGGAATVANVNHTATANSAWTQSSGTFVANAASTRFLFNNVTSPAAGYGNLIDDVRFTTYSACPISVTIVAGRNSNYVIRNNEQNSTNFQYYAPQAAVIDNLSSISSGLTASVLSTSDTSSAISLGASTTGTFTLNYTIRYSFGGTTYNSISTLTVRVVPEVTSRAPSVLPVDPSLSSKALSGITFATASNIYVCIDQVDSSGNVLSPTTITVNQGSLVSGVTAISSSPFTDSATVSAMTSQMPRVRIQANSGVLGRGGTKYIRVRAASIDNTDGVARSCDNGINFRVELKIINKQQTNRKELKLRNGRQVD